MKSYEMLENDEMVLVLEMEFVIVSGIFFMKGILKLLRCDVIVWLVSQERYKLDNGDVFAIWINMMKITYWIAVYWLYKYNLRHYKSRYRLNLSTYKSYLTISLGKNIIYYDSSFWIRHYSTSTHPIAYTTKPETLCTSYTILSTPCIENPKRKA